MTAPERVSRCGERAENFAAQCAQPERSPSVSEKTFNKILAANRGEIAVRIFRACYDLGIHTVAMYSKEDTFSLFRTKADEAYLIGENKSPLGAYLDIPEIIVDA